MISIFLILLMYISIEYSVYCNMRHYDAVRHYDAGAGLVWTSAYVRNHQQNKGMLYSTIQHYTATIAL